LDMAALGTGNESETIIENPLRKKKKAGKK
jgi:hypothetical protein